MFGNIFGRGNDKSDESSEISEADSIQPPKESTPQNDQSNQNNTQHIEQNGPTQPQLVEQQEPEIELDEDDPEEMADIKREIANFNPENPDYAVDFDPSTSDTQMDRELMIMSKTGEGPYTGAWPRAMFEQGYENPKAATWIGYVSSTRTGLREVPVSHNAWFRHAAIFGTTGYGKTTLLKNLMVQWAWDGWGFCFIDPKGDGVEELMQEIPSHRLDDVIWIDPSPTHSDRVVGINFMEPGSTEGPRQFAEEVESIIDDLRNIVKNESYWGPKMDGIMSNIARGMIQSDKPYTLIDMYYILLDERYRELFVAEVDDPAVQRYTKVISEEMDQSDLDPLLRRLQRMVENRVTREIIAHREATVNLKDAVEEQKIILVKNDIDSSDIKTMVATGIMRRVWAAIKSRTGTAEETRTPFFMIIDEFDDVVSEDADVDKMLSKARSMRMSVTLCCQQPSQLPRTIRKSIFGNCDNLLALNPNEPDDASHIMKRFGDYDATDLTNLGRFKMFTRIMVGNSQSEPFLTNTFPDYPPLRTEEEAYKAITASLKKYGRQRLDPVKAVEDVIIGKEEYGMDETSLLSDSDSEENEDEKQSLGARAEEGAEVTAENIDEREILESILAVEIRNPDKDFIPLDKVKDEIERRAGDTGYQSISANIFEQLPNKYCTTERHSGEQVVKLKPAGRSEVFTQDTGSAATGGGNDHRYVLKRAYKSFTRAGMIITRPTQEGDALPDAVADLPMDMSAPSYQKAQRKMEKLKREWPDAAEISGGSDIYIEAETTTIEKPKQTLRNLKKALNADRKCVFAIKDTSDKYDYIAKHGETAIKILTDPPCVAGYDSNGNRRFYNQSTKLEVADNVYGLRPADSGRHAYWWENKGGISIIGSDQKQEPLAHYENAEEVNNPTKQSVPAYYHYDRSNNIFVVTVNKENGETEVLEYNDKDNFKEDWKPIRPPFIPEYEFPRMPQEDDWMIVVYPDDDKDVPPLHLEYNGYDADGNLDVTLKPLLKEDTEKWNPQALAPYVDDTSKIQGYTNEETPSTDTTEDTTTTESQQELDETDSKNNDEETVKHSDETDSKNNDEKIDESTEKSTGDSNEKNTDEDEDIPDFGFDNSTNKNETEETETENNSEKTEKDTTEKKDNGKTKNPFAVTLTPKKAGQTNKDDEKSENNEESHSEDGGEETTKTKNVDETTKKTKKKDKNVKNKSNKERDEKKKTSKHNKNKTDNKPPQQKTKNNSKEKSKRVEYKKRNPHKINWLLTLAPPMKPYHHHVIDPKTDTNKAIISGEDTENVPISLCGTQANPKNHLKKCDDPKEENDEICPQCMKQIETTRKAKTTGNTSINNTSNNTSNDDKDRNKDIENEWDTEYTTQQRKSIKSRDT